jgi:hypothetical protein
MRKTRKRHSVISGASLPSISCSNFTDD